MALRPNSYHVALTQSDPITQYDPIKGQKDRLFLLAYL